MSVPKKGLGGGLSNLFGGDVTDRSAASAVSGVTLLSISQIKPNPNQPRKVFDEEKLETLAESIRQHGIITPITVRPADEQTYQIIAGERRWRAAHMAELKEIPAMIVNADESEVMILALIENLQRQNLNPIEEAEGYDMLMRQFGMTQEEVAQRVVKSRSAVANSIRLLSLPDEVRTMVSEGNLSSGHARAVLSVAAADQRVKAAQKMANMTVRQAEAFAKRWNKQLEDSPPPEKKAPYEDIEKNLESALGRKVTVTQGKNNGLLSLEFYGAEDLERLVEALGGLRV